MGAADLKIIRTFSVETELSKEEKLSLKATASLVCKASFINVLTDNDGASISNYEAALRGEKNPDKFQLELQATHGSELNLVSIGFSEQFPDGSNAPSFLKESGFSPLEIEAILDEYDLRKHSYLYCPQLPPPAMRQLWLLRAMKSNAKVLLLRDPFQPFNGRWREQFAKLLLEDAAKNDRVVICTWVGFTPQIWSSNPAILESDVGDLAYLAAKKAKSEELARRGKEATNSPLPEKSEPEKLSVAELAPQAAANSESKPYELPAGLAFGYKATQDFIFTPLAHMSNFARGNAFVGGLLGFALIIGVMMTVMVPNLPGLRAKLQSMNFDISWAQVAAAMKTEPEVENKPPEPEAVELQPVNIVTEIDSQEAHEIELENEEILPDYSYLDQVDFAALMSSISIEPENIDGSLGGAQALACDFHP